MTNELIINANQNPGIVTFDNYEEVKARIVEQLEFYNKTDYSTRSLEEITADRDDLKAIKKQITTVKKGLEQAYDAPLEDVKNKLDELVKLIDEPLKKLETIVKETEAETRKAEIVRYAEQKASELGVYAQKILGSDSFYDPRWWVNKSTTKKTWKSAIDLTVDNAKRDINTIVETGGDQQQVMLARYYETLSMDGMTEFLQNVNTSVENASFDVEEDVVIGYKVIKVFGNQHRMMQLFSEIELLGIDYEELEDGMPKEMEELFEPDFDTFVAFDIEHTGTFGVSKGDAEAEIVEIGAVKVVNGEIVDRFDELANPGRKIVPLVSRMTGITDVMVQDMPSVDEIITKFRDFIGDSILVGHNITGCDIPHIQRAAKRAGFKFENRFLDTKKLASKQKNALGLSNIKLTTLSEYYGIEQNEAHRAWCDAEANAKVYLKLKSAF